MRRAILVGSCLMALFICGVQSGVAQEKDRVFPTKGGAAPMGKITERTKEKVVVEVRGTPQNFPTNEIARIVFEGEPSQLSRGKDFVHQGQYEQGEEELKKVAVSSLTSEEMKEEYVFYASYAAGGLALQGKGDPKDATQKLLNWAKKYQNSHNFYAASEMLGNLAIALGSPEQAAKFYGAYAAAPFPEYKLKGGYLQGKALMAMNQNAEAKAKFEAVTQAKLSDANSLKIQKLATVASIKCDAASGKANEAISALEKMVDEGDATDAELFAELFNAIGAIYQSQNNPYEAVLSYLKTDLLYATQPEAHAEALYNLSQLWSKVGEQQNAIDAKSRLGKLYPTSTWVKK